MAANNIIKTNQYLTFRLGKEIYAFDVGNAREILECSDITQIPNTPDWIRGVINLRGNVVPVLDLKMKFGMGSTEQSVNTCVIIVESMVNGEFFVAGILADAVQEVFELDANKIEPPPKFGVKLSTQYIRGMGRRNEQLFIILDAERVFSGKELTIAQEVAEETSMELSVEEDEKVQKQPSEENDI